MNTAAETIAKTAAPVNFTPKQIKNFWKKVLKSPDADGCWLWTGAKSSHGYGSFNVGKNLMPHRFSWMIHFGEIPDYFLVCHRCDVPLCVNPNHFFLGTSSDNAKDCAEKGRSNKPTGKSHFSQTNPEKNARGEQFKTAKLTTEKVLQIRERFAAGGVLQRELGEQHGVSQVLIGLIVRRKAWKHI